MDNAHQHRPWTRPRHAVSNVGIEQYRWIHRLLVIFARDSNSASLEEQRQIVNRHQAGLAERDVLVIWVIGNSVTAEPGSPPRFEAAALRTLFDVGDGEYSAVLVGKDGGTKMRSSTPIGAACMFGLIDAMPMRRDEMRERGIREVARSAR